MQRRGIGESVAETGREMTYRTRFETQKCNPTTTVTASITAFPYPKSRFSTPGICGAQGVEFDCGITWSQYYCTVTVTVAV